ncbi:hypothetical protein CASFOL_029337 [Castilleja foliolosa]|uniref:FAD-binding domain-containing protein n=1 Tax=Castilleja foliolosa TaxID=1961234 RepID=A0ABD3CA96_9LAMI
MQWYAFSKEANDSHIPSTRNKNKVLEAYGDWCDEVVRTIVNTEEHMIIRRPIHDIDMLHTWGKGRVILLGDAAHAMLPSLGQGGSLAIEDCYWLVTELRNQVEKNPLSLVSLEDLTMVFRRFEKKSRFRVSTMHSICRITSALTSFYSTHLNISPLPFFNHSAIKVKHPSFILSSTLLKFVLPKLKNELIA